MGKLHGKQREKVPLEKYMKIQNFDLKKKTNVKERLSTNQFAGKHTQLRQGCSVVKAVIADYSKLHRE